MRSKTLTGINGPDRPAGPAVMTPNVVTYTNPADIPNPLPPGATVDAVLLTPTWVEGALNPERLEKFAKMGSFLQSKGVGPGDIDYAAMAGLLATGFALGGPVGLVAAALVAACQFLGGSTVPAPWVNSAPGVVAYCATFMPEDFSGANGWIWANAPDALTGIDKCQRAFVNYTIDKWGFVLDPLERNYSNLPNALLLGDWSTLSSYGQSPPSEQVRNAFRNATLTNPGAVPVWMAETYANLGVDYDASLAARRDGRTGRGFVYIENAAKVTTPADTVPDETSQDTGLATAVALAGLGYALTR